MKAEVGIIGYGVVGKAAEKTISKFHNTICYDKYQPSSSFEELKNTDFVFITVPTPFDSINNSVDLSAVKESLEKLNSLDYEGIVIIKSTISPQSTDDFVKGYDLDIVFNPEFLRESITPNEDFANQEFVIIGTPSSKAYEKIVEMYSYVLKKDTKYFLVSYKEAELIKYAQNTTLASRVAIANIIYDACKELNVDYNHLRELAFDNFEILGPHMVQVPGPDGKRGFGGKCLPKDIAGFNSKFNSDIIREIIAYNKSLREDLEF